MNPVITLKLSIGHVAKIGSALIIAANADEVGVNLGNEFLYVLKVIADQLASAQDASVDQT